MIRRNFLQWLVVLTVSSAVASAQSAHFDGTSWWDCVKVLADDNMEGRDTGSAGERKAQAYVVDRFKQAGLLPAGTNGYYQPVKFISKQILEKESSLALIRDGKAEPLVLGDDAFFSTRASLAPHVKAPLVFVAYGLQVPEMNYDDLAGLDLKGKVAVYISGSPAEIPAPLSAHSQSAGERWKALRAAGAIGVISIPNPASMDVPWTRMSLNRAHPSMRLAKTEFNDTEGEELAVTFNPARADLLFAGSGHDLHEIADLAKDRKAVPRFPLSVSIVAHAKVQSVKVESANLVAKLEGSDPVLKNEYVVLSAHLDHVGIGEPIQGDRIYNGAMDNASGTALLVDVAASLQKSPEKLRRSLLFVVVTGEEKGLLGSRYFAAHPTVPRKSIVADLNEDMFLPIIPLRQVIVYGLAESDLGDLARAAAQTQNVSVQPDPEPLRNAFVRSDQYSFIREGIPALAMSFGFERGSPEQKTMKAWLTQRYHAPSDDTSQPVDLAAEAKFEEIYRTLVIAVAVAAQKPAWKPDSFFRRYAL